MAERKSPGRKRAAKKKADVIDVGDRPAEKEAEDEDEEKESEEGLDNDLLQAAQAIDVEEPSDEEPEPRQPATTRGGSLARRDPMAAYMSETRRYPLLTPDEEHALAVKLVEHGDSAAARKLIEANLRLVVKIAYEYRRRTRICSIWSRKGTSGSSRRFQNSTRVAASSCRAMPRSGSAHTSSSSSSITGGW